MLTWVDNLSKIGSIPELFKSPGLGPLLAAVCNTVPLLCIVENDSQGVSVTRVNGADPVPKGRSIVAARASNGAMMNGKYHPVAPVRREHFDTRLLSRALFGEHEITAFKIPPPLTQEKGDLKRKDNLPV